MQSLSILLPVTSKGQPSPSICLTRLQALGCSLTGSGAAAGGGTPAPTLSICLGINEDDPLSEFAAHLEHCFPPTVEVALHRFSAAGLAAQWQLCGSAAPICWMWNQLAGVALRTFQPQWMVLLGDDTQLAPAGWPAVLAGFLGARPHLRCVALLDAQDPGFPSFPVVAASHLRLFGRMVPEEFVNQGGDPFLYELYRSIGAAAVCPLITVRNTVGGIQGSIFCSPVHSESQEPRYSRKTLPVPLWRQLLTAWRTQLLSKLPQERRRLQVAVAVPSYRVVPAALELILERCSCSEEDVDVRVLIQLDNPQAPPHALDWLRRQQSARLDKLRVRINGSNQGAAATRNALLDEAAACDLVIFFDDDVVPASGCVDAYVSAFRTHPKAAGFAGPTFLPEQPDKVLPCAIHTSDVSFFWEAPSKLGQHVPWAITANMALPYTNTRFRDGFPKTGGGEDVDFCVQLGARLQAVPGAVAIHPWWPKGRPWVYMRFWRWAEGDGRLIQLWPELAYWRAPNPPELCLLLLAAAPLLLACSALPASALPFMLAATLAADLAYTLLRNCCLAQRRRQHPCAHWWMRPLVAAEAWVIATLFSETGRLVGHLRRGSWRSLCSSFDWFCGSKPAVLRGEQQRAALRGVLCAAAAAAAVWLAGLRKEPVAD